MLSLSSIGTVHAIAEQIESPPRTTTDLQLEIREPVHAVITISAGRDFTELRALREVGPSLTEWVGSSVTIQRPEVDHWNAGQVKPAELSWSSASSRSTLDDAVVTAKLLTVAVMVAQELDRWARDGELERIQQDLAAHSA